MRTLDELFDGPPEKRLRLVAKNAHEEGRALLASAALDGADEIERQREVLAFWMKTNGFATGHGDTMDEMLKELTWQLKELRGRAESEFERGRQVGFAEAVAKSKATVN